MNEIENRAIKKVTIIGNPNAGNYYMRLPFLEKQIGIEPMPYKHKDITSIVEIIKRKLTENQIETAVFIPQNIE